jgi:hypothetical protein
MAKKQTKNLNNQTKGKKKKKNQKQPEIALFYFFASKENKIVFSKRKLSNEN